MKIEYKDIYLRDAVISDIDDEIRWMTTETEWAKWDAPWESLNDIKNFDQEKYRKEEMAKLAKFDNQKQRWHFELCTKDHIHIGSVNAYLIDENYEWKKEKDGGIYPTIGIDICEAKFWGKGYGTQGLLAFIKYFLDHGYKDIFLQTWSGNYRMVGCAKKIGFEIANVIKDLRNIDGVLYDALTFKLNIAKFNQIYEKNEW